MRIKIAATTNLQRVRPARNEQEAVGRSGWFATRDGDERESRRGRRTVDVIRELSPRDQSTDVGESGRVKEG